MDSQIKTIAEKRGLVGDLPRAALRPKFAIASIGALAFVLAATWLALPWIGSLADSVTLPVAAIIVVFIALIPGFLNIFLLLSLLLYRQRPLELDFTFPPGISPDRRI